MTGKIELASRANGAGGAPASSDGFPAGIISGDGRHVAFTALGAFDGANVDGKAGQVNAYVRDLDTSVTRLVSVKSDGTAGGGVSAPPVPDFDGNNVAFISDEKLDAGDTDDRRRRLHAGGHRQGGRRDLLPVVQRRADTGSGRREPGRPRRQRHRRRLVRRERRLLRSGEQRRGRDGDARRRQDAGRRRSDRRAAAVLRARDHGRRAVEAPVLRHLGGPRPRTTRTAATTSTTPRSPPSATPPTSASIRRGRLDQEVSSVSGAKDGAIVVYTSESDGLPGGSTNFQQVYQRVNGVDRNISQPPGRAPRVGRRGLVARRLQPLRQRRRRQGRVHEPARPHSAAPNDEDQITVRDVVSGATSLLSAEPDGTPGDNGADEPTIDAAGDKVAFVSSSSDLLVDRQPERRHARVRPRSQHRESSRSSTGAPTASRSTAASTMR